MATKYEVIHSWMNGEKEVAVGSIVEFDEVPFFLKPNVRALPDALQEKVELEVATPKGKQEK